MPWQRTLWAMVAIQFINTMAFSVLSPIMPTANALVGRLVTRAERGTVYGITASAMFLGNSMGPLTGGAVAAAWGLRWVFVVTAAVLFLNLVWVYYSVDDKRVLDQGDGG